MIDAAEVLLNATLQRQELEAAEVIAHRQSQDRRETASLLRDAPLVDENATRRGLVDPEHAEALMAKAGRRARARAVRAATRRRGIISVDSAPRAIPADEESVESDPQPVPTFVYEADYHIGGHPGLNYGSIYVPRGPRQDPLDGPKTQLARRAAE